MLEMLLACEGDSGALSPLHVAASHGLASFARRLSALPAAHVAASLLDFDGQTPSNLARCRGNVATADVIDRLTNQHTVSDGGEYIIGMRESFKRVDNESFKRLRN